MAEDTKMVASTERCVGYFKYVVLDLLEPLGENYWVAGGAVRDFFSIGRCTTDVDIYFPSTPYYEQAQKIMDDSEECKEIYRDDKTTIYRYKKNKVQLVGNHFFDTPQATIEAFDFTVCCAAVDRERLYHHETFFIDLAGRKLVINRIRYPLSTLQRLQKYIKKGFTICNGGLMAIARAIQRVDLDNPSENTFGFYPDGTPKFVRFD